MNRILVVRIDSLVYKLDCYINRSHILWKIEFESLFLGLGRLKAGVAQVRHLPLGAVLHLGIAAVCCLGVIMPLGFADFLAVRCLCGH